MNFTEIMTCQQAAIKACEGCNFPDCMCEFNCFTGLLVILGFAILAVVGITMLKDYWGLNGDDDEPTEK